MLFSPLSAFTDKIVKVEVSQQSFDKVKGTVLVTSWISTEDGHEMTFQQCDDEDIEGLDLLINGLQEMRRKLVHD